MDDAAGEVVSAGGDDGQGVPPCYSKAMAKVTSKFQVSIPKALAEQLHIRPGDDIEWRITGGELRIVHADASRPLSRERRLELFDLASQRQAARNKLHRPKRPSSPRGWTRDDLYDRGHSR